MKKKTLIISILIPFFIALISTFLMNDSSHIYNQLNLPSFALSYTFFPIIWSVLYILIGIACYYIYMSHSSYREASLIIYGFQFIINLTWPLFFFNFQNYFLSFMILIVLIVLVIIMLYYFYYVKKIAFFISLPYLLWLFFTLYLNFYIFLYN